MTAVVILAALAVLAAIIAWAAIAIAKRTDADAEMHVPRCERWDYGGHRQCPRPARRGHTACVDHLFADMWDHFADGAKRRGEHDRAVRLQELAETARTRPWRTEAARRPR